MLRNETETWRKLQELHQLAKDYDRATNAFDKAVENPKVIAYYEDKLQLKQCKAEEKLNEAVLRYREELIQLAQQGLRAEYGEDAEVKMFQDEIDELRDKIKTLKKELHKAQRNNELRNLQLDALHFVWCSGGCENGVHRWTKEELTAEIVAEAIRNTKRLESWYISAEGRKYMTGGPWSGMKTLKKAWKDARKRIYNLVKKKDS